MAEYELQVSDITPAVCYALLNNLNMLLNAAISLYLEAYLTYHFSLHAQTTIPGNSTSYIMGHFKRFTHLKIEALFSKKKKKKNWFELQNLSHLHASKFTTYRCISNLTFRLLSSLMFIVNRGTSLYITTTTFLRWLSDRKESQNNSGTNNFSLLSFLHNYDARGPTDSLKSVLCRGRET